MIIGFTQKGRFKKALQSLESAVAKLDEVKDLYQDKEGFSLAEKTLLQKYRELGKQLQTAEREHLQYNKADELTWNIRRSLDALSAKQRKAAEGTLDLEKEVETIFKERVVDYAAQGAEIRIKEETPAYQDSEIKSEPRLAPIQIVPQRYSISSYVGRIAVAAGLLISLGAITLGLLTPKYNDNNLGYAQEPKITVPVKAPEQEKPSENKDANTINDVTTSMTPNTPTINTPDFTAQDAHYRANRKAYEELFLPVYVRALERSNQALESALATKFESWKEAYRRTRDAYQAKVDKITQGLDRIR